MNLPTKITMIRILLVPAFVAIFLIDSIPYNRLIALAIFAVAALTDFLDGYIARKYNLVTDLGKFLDPIADKLLVMSALVLLSMGTRVYELVVAICTIIILSREFIISAFRMIAGSKGVVLSADKLGKIKTVVQMIALIVLIPIPELSLIGQQFDIAAGIEVYTYAGYSLLVIATLLTLISGANYLIKNREVLRG